MAYHTLWAYITPSALAQAATSGSREEISQAIINFLKDWTQSHQAAATQKSTSQMLEGITNFLSQFADVNLDELAKRLPSTFGEIASSGGEIFEEMVNFFKQDDWPFVQIEVQPVLQMAFQGENGKWTCYARARVDQQQFVFYSVCPVNAPDSKRLAIAEFLTRANYDMVIGNFELDFADGEIRYKTSIDVEGDNLSFALIKQLVYANVRMMDTYLPLKLPPTMGQL